MSLSFFTLNSNFFLRGLRAARFGLGGLAMLLAWSSLLSSCQPRHEAPPPVYLALPDLSMETDYNREGTASDAFTTAWVLHNQEVIGIYELPAVLPATLGVGNHNVTVLPAMNLNGISGLRTIYSPVNPIEFSLDITEEDFLDTLSFSARERSTTYQSFYEVELIENFDQAGLNFQKLNNSDTTLERIKDPDSTFSYTPPYASQPENNGQAGLIALSPENRRGEFSSISTYSLPRGLQNLFVELNYRTNIPFSVGLVAITPDGERRQITVTLNPKEEWSKLYLDLITEYNAFPNASGYKLYVRSQLPAGRAAGRIFLDNLKLVYSP